MNNLILSLADAILENKELKDYKLSFVSHSYKGKYTEHIKSYNNKLPLEENIKKVKSILSKGKIKSFNITLEIESGTSNWLDGGEDINYKKDWYVCRFIFYGEGKINAVFDMGSSYFGLDQTHFTTYFPYDDKIGEHGVRIDKNIKELIQNFIDLKNILIENGKRTISQLEKIKNNSLSVIGVDLK